MVVVVVLFSHAGELPAERTKGAGNRLPLADGSLRRDVGANGRKSGHPLIDVVREHHLTSTVAPVVYGIGERR